MSKILNSRYNKILQQILTCPTAPYREQQVRDFILEFCKKRKLRIQQDSYGNLTVISGTKTTKPALLFAAHMDHPGFIADTNSVRNRTTALFYGGVEERYFTGASVRFFTDPGPVKGTVIKTNFNLKKQIKKCWLNLSGPVSKSDLGMWDLSPCTIQSNRIYSRACDDLIGCAALLILLDELARRKIQSRIRILFTVAEEAGLHGAKAVCLQKKLPKDSLVISVETSSILPDVKAGDGVILRVGDRMSVFDSAASSWIEQKARTLQKKSKSFAFQRKLMDAGTCEGTIYQRFGHCTAAIGIPLGNYHNRNVKTGKIASEYVAVSDFQNMVSLFYELAKDPASARPFLKTQKPRYKKRKSSLGEFFFE